MGGTYAFDRCADTGLFNNGFEIRGCWNGRDIPLHDFLGKVQRMKWLLEMAVKQRGQLLPEDLAAIQDALK